MDVQQISTRILQTRGLLLPVHADHSWLISCLFHQHELVHVFTGRHAQAFRHNRYNHKACILMRDQSQVESENGQALDYKLLQSNQQVL